MFKDTSTGVIQLIPPIYLHLIFVILQFVVSSLMNLIFKPSISTHSKPRTLPRTRLLKCFGLQHSTIKTKHLSSYEAFNE